MANGLKTKPISAWVGGGHGLSSVLAGLGEDGSHRGPRASLSASSLVGCDHGSARDLRLQVLQGIGAVLLLVAIDEVAHGASVNRE